MGTSSRSPEIDGKKPHWEAEGVLAGILNRKDFSFWPGRNIIKWTEQPELTVWLVKSGKFKQSNDNAFHHMIGSCRHFSTVGSCVRW